MPLAQGVIIKEDGGTGKVTTTPTLAHLAACLKEMSRAVDKLVPISQFMVSTVKPTEPLGDFPSAPIKTSDYGAAAVCQGTFIPRGTIRVASWAREEEIYSRHAAFFDQSKETVVKFSGKNVAVTVRSWIVKLERSALINAWDAQKKLAVAVDALTGFALDWYTSSERWIDSWDELKDGLISVFQVDRTGDIGQIQALMAEGPRTGEPLVYYVHRIRYLGYLADTPDAVTISCFVEGVPVELRRKLSLAVCKNFDEVRFKVERFCRLRRPAKNDQIERRSSSRIKKRCYSGPARSNGRTPYSRIVNKS